MARIICLPTSVRSIALCLGLVLLTVTPALNASTSDSEIEALKADLQKSPEDVKSREALAIKLAESNRFAEIIPVLDPYSHQIQVSALHLLGKAYDSKKDFTNALRIYRIIADKDPENYWAHFQLGHAYLNTKNSSEAVKSFRKAIQLKPKHRESYEAIFKVFENNNNNYESRNIVRDMIQKFGNNSQWLNALCRLYAVDGFLEEAVRSCKDAIRKSPQYADNHVYLAMSYKDRGDEKMASAILVKASDQFKQSEFTQFTAGRYYSEQKNFPVAARYFSQAVKADPKQARSQLGLAEALFETGQHEQALSGYVEACRLDSQNRPHLMAAAFKLRSLGKDKLSRQYEGQAYKCAR